MTPVTWAAVGTGLAALLAAVDRAETPATYPTGETPSLPWTVVEVGLFGVVSGTLVYAVVSGAGVPAVAGFLVVAAVAFLLG